MAASRLKSESNLAFIPLCRLDDLVEGAALGFDPTGVGRTTVFALRKSGSIHVYRDICPHYGATTLAWKRNAYLAPGGEYIACSAHGALFQIEDGVCISGPCLDQALQSVAHRVESDLVLIDPDAIH
jgi:nitrite reductase/ring-hydroxylating ferredoxin subunit